MYNQPCWNCKNFSTCNWSYGKPIEGWEAIKTRESYKIINCPQFEVDSYDGSGKVFDVNGYRQVSAVEISNIINKSTRTVFRYLCKETGKLNKLLNEKGYEFKKITYSKNVSIYLIKELGVKIMKESEVKPLILEILRNDTITKSSQGYTYLYKAVMMCYTNKKLVNTLTTELFPIIAEEYATTPTRIERAMRYAISTSKLGETITEVIQTVLMMIDTKEN